MNPAGKTCHLPSNSSNDFNGSFFAGKGLSFSRVSIASQLADPSSVDASKTQLLGSFSNVKLTTYSGSKSGLSSWWTHSKEVAIKGNKGIAGPTDLSSGGTAFKTELGL